MTTIIEAANTEWVWGKQAVRELLRTNPLQVKLVWLAPSSKDPINREIQERCQEAKVPIAYKDRKAWEEIFRVPAHQSVAAQLKFAFRYTSLEELLRRIKAAEDPAPVLVMIDHLQDPHNLGAIIRTAAGAGVRGIILPKDRTCPISGTVHKTAAGALETLPLAQVTNLAQTIEVLKKEGFWFLSLEAQGSQSIYQLDLRVPLVVVIGSEGKGVSPLILKRSDWVGSIPMEGRLTSLNASVACAVVLFEILRQKEAPPLTPKN
jgi:23S rRNA (guanosine2251-2'-O)-methyltransferase